MAGRSPSDSGTALCKRLYSISLAPSKVSSVGGRAEPHADRWLWKGVKGRQEKKRWERDLALRAELSTGHSARQQHPGSMPPALLIHLQVQIKQKGQTGKSFVAGGHVPTTPQPHVALWPAFPLPAWTL